MKLRISNQSLRLRINQDDLQQLVSTGKIEETFGNDIMGRIAYSLLTCESEKIDIKLSSGHITVMIPLSFVSEWNSTDRVSFEQHISGVRVLLEKDFQCLTERPHEDESLNFKNPKIQH